MVHILSLLAFLLLASAAGAQPILAPGDYQCPPAVQCTLESPSGKLHVPAPLDTTPPIVAMLPVTGLTQTTATINASTNELATAVVQYGLTTAYGTTTSPSPQGTVHQFTLSSLQAGQTYHYRLTATDVAGNVSAPSPDGTFQTQAQVVTLTVAKAGTGAGSITGPGITCGADCTESVPVGTTIILTAAPNAGSGLTNWSVGSWQCQAGSGPPPTVCSVTVTSNVTITATFDLLPPPPSGGAGTLTKIVSGAGAAANWYFSHIAVEPCGQGRIWHTWANTTRMFTPATNTWSTLPTNTIGWRENFGSAWDCTHNVVWIGSQVSYPGPFDGYTRFDVATNQYSAAPDAGSSQQIICYHPASDKLSSFAGWTTNQLKQRPADASSPWVTQSAAPALPIQSQDGARMTQLRGGCDSRNGMLWYIGDNSQLYTRMPTDAGWTARTTTGVVPPLYTVYALHEGSNTIVGWSGCSAAVTPCPGGPQQMYLLDMTTWTWRLGLGPSSGVPLPMAAVMAQLIAAYDKVNDRVLLMVANGATAETDLWQWKPSAGGGVALPVPLTTAKTGDGGGTITGAGSYLPSAPVTVAAQPDTVSMLSGISPSDPCAKGTFPMPASALTCTALFTRKPPPPTDTRTFKAKSLPVPVGGQPPPWVFSRDGNTKDVPCDYDKVRDVVYCGTGDFTGYGASDSGRNEVYAYDPKTNTATLLSTYCHPSGQISPNHSSDKGPFFYRAKDDALYLWGGIHFPDQVGQVCSIGTPNGSIYTNGLLRFDLATRRWSVAAAMEPGSDNEGRYDEATDTLIYVRSNPDCGGGAIWELPMATLVPVKVADLCGRPAPSFPTTQPGFYAASLTGYLQNFAWDPIQQKAWLVLTHGWLGGSCPDPACWREAFLWEWDRKTGAVTQKAKPSVTTVFGAGGAADYVIAAHWSPQDQRVLWPVVRDPCGKVEQMLAFDPATNSWQAFTVKGDLTQDIRGTSQVMTAAGLMLAGSVFCAVGNQQYVFTWGP